MLPLGRSTVGWAILLRANIGPRAVVLGSAVRTADLPGGIRSLFGLPVRLPVSGRRADFEFVELVPLFIGTIPFGDGSQFADPTTRINGFWIIHADIMDYTAVLVQYYRQMKRVDIPKAIIQAPLSAL